MSKGKIVWNLIWKFIWLFFKIAMWAVGLVAFLNVLNNYPDMDPFWRFLLAWVIWGGFCAVAILRDTLAGAFGGGKRGGNDGAARGANTYTIDSHGTIENHPLSGRILGFIGGFIGGLLGGVLVGPIIVPRKMITNIKDIVRYCKQLKAMKAETKE